MNDLQEKIVGLISQAGGSIGWQDLMNGLDYREQQAATNAIRALEGIGSHRRIVGRDAETGAMAFTVNEVR